MLLDFYRSKYNPNVSIHTEDGEVFDIRSHAMAFGEGL